MKLNKYYSNKLHIFVLFIYRVIFLDITNKDCKNRITDRRINMYTGKIYSAYDTKDDLVLNKQLLTHPEDTECKVDFDHENCQEYISVSNIIGL